MSSRRVQKFLLWQTIKQDRYFLEYFCLVPYFCPLSVQECFHPATPRSVSARLSIGAALQPTKRADFCPVRAQGRGRRRGRPCGPDARTHAGVPANEHAEAVRAAQVTAAAYASMIAARAVS